MKEIVLIVGYPASGKTTLSLSYQNNGYYRLSKDNFGGSLNDINQRLEELIVQGWEKFVIDNNYPTVASRKRIIEIAKKYDYHINCVILSTSIENSQNNAAIRIIKKMGRLLMPDEITKSDDPEILSATEIFNFRRIYEKPTDDEGFDEIKTSRFTRKKVNGYINRAIFFDLDTIRYHQSGYKVPTSKEDIQIYPHRLDYLRNWKNQGYLLIAISNQNAIGKERLTNNDVKANFVYTNHLLDNIIDDFGYCPHDTYPIQCYCKKPMPGLGVEFVEKYKIDVSSSHMLCSETADKTFAKRCGLNPIEAEETFPQ